MIGWVMDRLGTVLIVGILIYAAFYGFSAVNELSSSGISNIKSNSGGINQCIGDILNCKQTSITIGGTTIGK